MVSIRRSNKIAFAVGSLFLSTALSTIAWSLSIQPCAAIVAIQAESSTLAGIAMPKGATHFNRIDDQIKGILNALSKEKIVGLPATTDKVEVFIWQGDNYREDRVGFTKSSLKRAFTSAGYIFTEISRDDLRETNVFEYFDLNDTSLPFHPALTKRIEYFRATNESKGQTVIGVWLEDENALTVGMLPVQFKAAKKPVPLPDVTGANVVLVKDIHNTMKGIPPTKLPVYEAIAKKAGTVRGLIKDAAGKPIAGAQIAVHSSVGGGFRTTHKAVSNAKGFYEVLLPVGIAEVVEAKCTVNYNGVKYDLPLTPVGEAMTQFTSQTGHVANFVLRTEGDFGGTIRVLDNVDHGTLEVTITPEGRLMDGTMGRTFVYRYSAAEGSETFLNGIPIGRYKLTVRLLDDGEALPMQAGRTFGSDAERELKESLQVDFAPGYSFSQVNFGKSNKDIQIFEVRLEP